MDPITEIIILAAALVSLGTEIIKLLQEQRKDKKS
mgnify:FL=1